ncbi:MAG: polymer-forming cytoskeletal protein [Acidobacteriota bacterium]
MIPRLLKAALLLAALPHVFSAPVVLAEPQGSTSGLLLSLGEEAVVADDHHGDVIALAGNVRVSGRVSGDAVALLGKVKIEPGAEVSGNALAVLGRLDVQEGGAVGRRAETLGEIPVGEGLGYFGFAYSAPVLTLRLLGLLVVGVLASIGAWLGRHLVRRGAAHLQRHPWRIGGIGLLGYLILMLTTIMAIALVRVFVGLPLLFLLIVGWCCVAALGMACCFHALGGVVLSRTGPQGRFASLQFLVGFGIFAILHFIPLLGELSLLWLLALGTGAMLVMRFGGPKRVAVPA